MRIERHSAGEGPSFRLHGKLERGAVRHLLRVLSGPASAGESITVDLGALESCDADGVDALVALTRRARAATGDVLITGIRDDLATAFDAEGAAGELNVTRSFDAAGDA